MQRVRAGDNAELIELGDVTAQELHTAAALMRVEEGVLTCIPGHSSLYVIRGHRPASSLAPAHEARELKLPVQFDGEDLDELLERVTPEAFFERVAELRLTVRYLGFRGGFGYLEGWPEAWAMPRRPTSRTHVARGTFAIAGTMAGFYPIDSPGGWNLLGHTDVDLENALAPGDTILLEPRSVLGRPFVPARKPASKLRFADVIASPLTTVVTAPDWSGIERGIPPGGPFDSVAAALATRAVEGNVELLECAMAGPRLLFHRDAVLAWCTPDLQVQVEEVRAGEERRFGRISGGLRAYLAIGDAAKAVVSTERRLPGAQHVIHAIRGPHDVGLTEIECEVTAQLNRVGIRLRPLQPLSLDIPANLRSIGMQFGTVQLHPDGSLVAMGPDHPVTGGYLQPMTVITTERWKLGQLMPGERVRLLAES